MKKVFIFYSLILMLSFASAALSQQSEEISPEKKKLIAEIISVTEADKQAEESTKQFMVEMGKLYPSIVDSVLQEDDKLTPSQKAEVKKELLAKQAGFNKRFETKLFARINYKELIDKTIVPVYDKLFSEAELKDLLAFYKSPIGKKLTQVSPQLGTEVLNRTTTYLLPKVEGVIKELTEEGF